MPEFYGNRSGLRGALAQAEAPFFAIHAMCFRVHPSVAMALQH